MPRSLQWSVLHKHFACEAADAVIDRMRVQKPHKIYSSNVVRCTICLDDDPHNMRYRILQCVSSNCAKAGEGGSKCPWRAKVLSCLHRSIVDIFEMEQHFVRSTDPPSGKLSKKDNATPRSLAEAFVKPVRIRNKIADKNGGVAPSLDKLQNFAFYYRKSKMNNTDDMDELEKLIWANTYTGGEAEEEPFSFSVRTRPDGKVLLGEGTDNHEFFVGYTTKALLRRLDRDPVTFVFHVDATFKLSQVDYNTFVCGISDKSRVFHLVGLFVSSQRTEYQYSTMFASLKSVYYKVVEKSLVLRYVMGDADEAQFNAVVDSFDDGNVEYLMCFWHMITKLYEHGKMMTPAKLALVAADVYDMPYAVSESQFHALKTMTVRRWMADPDVAEFGRYFYRQWLTDSFTKWQCYRTPSAFATTNNPVETFNAILKKVYTLRMRMKMGLLLSQFARCCKHESFFGAKFAEVAKSTAKLRRRAIELRRMKLIEEMTALPGSNGEPDESDYVLVCVHPTPRIYVRPRKKTMELIEVCAQMGLNNTRMERDGQPEAGWAVNVRDRTCPCKYFFKHGECVHLYFALYKRYGSDTPTMRPLFNRSQRKRKRGLAEDIHDAVVAQQSSRGRPILNGPALSLV